MKINICIYEYYLWISNETSKCKYLYFLESRYEKINVFKEKYFKVIGG